MDTMENKPDNVKIVKREDKNSKKYIVVLKLVNAFLVNLGKDEIDDLTKFVNIDREDIIKEVNKQSLIDMEGELFPLFNKRNSGFYRKGDCIALNCLRGLVKELGYELFFVQNDIYNTINGQKFRKTCSYYSIK